MISFRYHLKTGDFALDLNENFDTKVTGIFGPSGSGKTTLLHLIAGIRKADSGYLSLNGRILEDSQTGAFTPTFQRQIAIVFQEGRLFPHLSVAQNLRYGINNSHKQKFDLSQIAELLEIENLLKKNPQQLSGGQAQRVALGRALLSSPRLLLLDEPLASLDLGLKRQILSYLRKIRNELQIPIIYISHDLEELLQLTQTLLILHNGQKAGYGHFLDLVQQEQPLSLIHDLGLLNICPLTLKSTQESEGISTLLPQKGPQWIGPLMDAVKGEKIYAALRPEDIALVKHPISDISIQNQIQGKIINIMHTSQNVLCLVDIGIPLLVEITAQAIHNLNLVKGQSVWCLFKAQALKGQRRKTTHTPKPSRSTS